MSTFVYGVPYEPPAPANVERVGVQDTWIGWDGSTWDLTGRTGGVHFRPGVRGR